MATPVVVTRIQNRRGTQDQFNGLNGIYPLDYNGRGGYNPPGTGPIGFTPTAYPTVLLPGELAFCTDTRRVFVGNVNGEYTEITIPTRQDDITLIPIVVELPFTTPPTGPPNWQPIPELQFKLTPFFTILYDLTDNIDPDWNTPGTNFARNGSLQITTTNSTPTLTDSGTEINSLSSSINFQVVFNSGNIEIEYTHNFPVSLTFSTSSISWIPF